MNAPKITIEQIEAKIDKQEFHRPAPLLTICVLTLENGYTVTGESSCVSPENFDETIGRNVARKNAVDKIWTLEGYLLKERLFQESK